MQKIALKSLLDLMSSYYSIYTTQFYEQRREDSTENQVEPRKLPDPPYFVAVLDYLKEVGYVFNYDSICFEYSGHIHTSDFFIFQRDIQHAFRELSKRFWQCYQSQHGEQIDPPNYFVDFLDHLERQYRILFKYDQGTFVEE
ncbi:hypothetical protein [Tunicatimonas pelagia]|uniref:hypothetical protein n=1 Tax=Tunicatimonas pelagia TaxID=931531 RepID=UPI002665CA8F|nr:hypothetical protein [Tunicatimonas pelagia]WKN46166.1 hypothetical protein P0M28_14525 [Tunicatimonas pelagia]